MDKKAGVKREKKTEENNRKQCSRILIRNIFLTRPLIRDFVCLFLMHLTVRNI